MSFLSCAQHLVWYVERVSEVFNWTKKTEITEIFGPADRSQDLDDSRNFGWGEKLKISGTSRDCNWWLSSRISEGPIDLSRTERSRESQSPGYFCWAGKSRVLEGFSDFSCMRSQEPWRSPEFQLRREVKNHWGFQIFWLWREVENIRKFPKISAEERSEESWTVLRNFAEKRSHEHLLVPKISVGMRRQEEPWKLLSFIMADASCCLVLLSTLFMFLLFFKSGGDNSVTDFTHTLVRSGLFLNLIQGHSF